LSFKEALEEVFEDFEEPAVEDFVDDRFFSDLDLLTGLDNVNGFVEEIFRVRHFLIFWD
jgi:hypothetical protein